MASTDEQLRSSGFKRILLRLDEDTRRKYCCRAVEEDLKHVKIQMRACKVALAEVNQVQDATRKLHASQRAAVSSKVLVELETLQTQLKTSLHQLVTIATVDQEARIETTVSKETKTMDMQQAKTLSKQILQTQELDTAVDGLLKLQRLMPVLNNVDAKKKTRWVKYVRKVVVHTVELLQSEEKEHKSVLRLHKTLGKMEKKWPELKLWHVNVDRPMAAKTKHKSALTTKRTKERARTVPDEGETATTRSVLSTGQPKAKGDNNEKKKKGQSANKARTLLQRCSREVRTLRDKFELGAYDVNLSRMVTIVDSLWADFDHSEVLLLTTALFTLVETVEKVVNQPKRRDRLVCLESVLGVVLGSSKLQLTTRRKTMVEEYANNCRQSLEQLHCQAESDKPPVASNETEQASAQRLIQATTSKRAPKAKATSVSEVWPKSHVRFG